MGRAAISLAQWRIGAAPPHPLDAKFSYLSISHHDTLPFVTVVALKRPKKRIAINAQVST